MVVGQRARPRRRLADNQLPHWLGVVARIVGGEPVRAAGRAWPTQSRAPVVPELHDFRDWRTKVSELTPADVAHLEWRECDADVACSALIDFLADGDGQRCAVPLTCVVGPGTGVPEEAEASASTASTGRSWPPPPPAPSPSR